MSTYNKKKSSTSGKGGYVHGPPKRMKDSFKARDSDERRIEMMKSLEIKRLKNAVERQKIYMQSYLPLEVRERKKVKINPMYDLKGAARPARDKYQDPNYKPVTMDDEINLLSEYSGKIMRKEGFY